MAVWTSLKSKLILYILSITILVLASLAAISYVTLGSFLRANLLETTQYRLRLAMDNIDRDMDRLVQLANYFTLAPDTAAFVTSSARYPEDRKFKALSAHRSVRDAVYGNGLDRYIDKLVIGGFEGHSIQFGLIQGDVSDFAVAREGYEKAAAPGAPAPALDGVIEEKFAFSTGRPAIPLGIGVFSDDDAERPIGFAYMAINLEVIFRFLDGYGLEDGSRLFIAMGDRAYGIERDRRLVEAPEVAAAGGPIRAALARGESSLGIVMGGREETLALCGGRATGWALAQTLPPVRTAQARGLYPSLFAAALLIVLLVALVLIAVNRTVNHPIARINKRVALISTGDFSHDPGIEWDNELGNIGRALNRMSRDIEELIERRVEDEKSKKELEFRVLQSQINPHFLYNTLGAIKWMAEIRKAPGIAEMVNSLAALLRHAARGAEGLVTLGLELELVGEYCTIQRYRSAKLFELRVDLRDESLRRCKVVKFMLQPIVENAIIHGIEPKMAPGLVSIEAYSPGPGRLRIDVVDDGVGIARDRLPGLSADRRSAEGTFNHIGLANVDERLKLAFGEEYGLSVESEEGAYTKVSFLLPRIVDPAPADGPADGPAAADADAGAAADEAPAAGGGPCTLS